MTAGRSARPATLPRRWLIAGLAAALTSCTAVRVVTHSTSTDPARAPAGAYRLDQHHWSVVFDVDHFGYSRFVMRFDRVQADLDFVSDVPEKSRLSTAIDAASVDTNDAELDALVKGSDMLDAQHFPEIRFTSTSIQRTGPSSGEMTGDLTLRDRTRPVTLQVTFNGGAPNPLTGAHTLGFAATGTFHRSAFGLSTWYPAVGDEVRVRIEAEFVKE